MCRLTDRSGGGKSKDSGKPGSPAKLAARLNRQRTKWLETVFADWRDAQSVLPDASTPALDSRAASAVASAFQAVHVLSLANANRYVDASDIGAFTRGLCEHLADNGITDKWKDAVRHYTELKAKPPREQLVVFSEDIAITMSGSPAAGMLLGPGLVPLANEFLLRNLGITADFFGDEATMRRFADAVREIQDAV